MIRVPDLSLVEFKKLGTTFASHYLLFGYNSLAACYNVAVEASDRSSKLSNKRADSTPSTGHTTNHGLISFLRILPLCKEASPTPQLITSSLVLRHFGPFATV
jgi:hypothetical protein